MHFDGISVIDEITYFLKRLRDFIQMCNSDFPYETQSQLTSKSVILFSQRKIAEILETRTRLDIAFPACRPWSGPVPN